MSSQQRTEYWQQQLDTWRNSALSGRAFCQQHALSYHQFIYWRRKLCQTDERTPAQRPTGFTRVTSVPVAAVGELAVTLPGGITITGLHAGNVELLGVVLRQL